MRKLELAAIPSASRRQVLDQWRLRSNHSFEGGLCAFLVHIGAADPDRAQELVLGDDGQSALIGKLAVEEAEGCPAGFTAEDDGTISGLIGVVMPGSVRGVDSTVPVGSW